MNEPNTRLPVKREASPPPALWQQAAPAVIRGAALIAAGVVGQWALRNAARKAISMPFTASRSDKKTKALAKREQQDEGIVAISETIVMRRVILRR